MAIQSTDSGSGRDRTALRAEMARALARGGMEEVQVISLEQAEEVLTPKRREIINQLRENDYDSVRALARALNRDKGHVSRDLGVLSEHAIVTYETDGRSKSPRLTQKYLVAEPIA